MSKEQLSIRTLLLGTLALLIVGHWVDNHYGAMKVKYAYEANRENTCGE